MKEKAIEICKNLTHTINNTKDDGIRSEFEWANSKATIKDLKRKRTKVMKQYDLTFKDLK
tara:strand:+ start:7976 stop:8155 length:180 start_codon:yes stop_codon:yes gene_type:complete